MLSTKNFSITELEKSNTAKEHGIDNSIPRELLVNAMLTLEKLEEVRKILGNNPILISSGYRCAELNKLVKGSATSAHSFALAADFACPSFGDPRDIVNALKGFGKMFDQLILENPDTNNSWVNIGFKQSGNRGQVLTKFSTKSTYSAGVQ